MDQDAFRALLNTPRDAKASSSNSNSTRTFGAKLKRSHDTTASQSIPKDKSTEFKPRPQANKKGKSGVKKEGQDGGTATASGYVDRAALRREGKDHEYSAVDALKAELEARSAAENGAGEALDDQYLGGDATHSVLVKGLDHSLLAQTKAKQETKQAQEAEDELDSLLPVLPSAAPASASSSKKRSRQDRIEELKNKLAGTSANKEEQPVHEEDAFRSKFRKVGQAAPSTTAPTTVTKDGKVKKLRKKKKPVESIVEPVIECVAESAALPQPVAVAAEKPVVPQQEEDPLDDVDPDIDIFAGAAEYGASSSDSESGEEHELPRKESLPIPSAIAADKKNWFDDDQDDVHADPIAAPSLPRRAPVPVVEEDASTSQRLKGFEANGGGVDVKSLLEMDRLAEKEEKRKERKAKYAKPTEGGGSGEPAVEKKKKKLTDADKLNRDHQELEAYFKKKKGGEPDEEED